MQLNFHGELARLYGPSVTMEADTIAEALEGFSRQQADWPRDMRVVVVGHDTAASLYEHADEIDVMPSIHGGGGKWGGILLGAVVVGVGALIGGPVGVSLMVSGGLMAAQGVVGLFMKAPSLTKNADPEASKYLGVNRNTAAAGTPIAFVYGLIKVWPHWLSLQSDSTNLSFGTFPATPT